MLVFGGVYHTWIPYGIGYKHLRFSSLAVDSGGEIVAASAKGAGGFLLVGEEGCGK